MTPSEKYSHASTTIFIPLFLKWQFIVVFVLTSVLSHISLNFCVHEISKWQEGSLYKNEPNTLLEILHWRARI